MRGDCSLKKEQYVVQVNKIKTVRRPQSRGVVSEAVHADSFLTYRPWQSPDSSQGCWLATVSRSTSGNLKRPENSDKGHHRKEGSVAVTLRRRRKMLSRKVVGSNLGADQDFLDVKSSLKLSGSFLSNMSFLTLYEMIKM